MIYKTVSWASEYLRNHIVHISEACSYIIAYKEEYRLRMFEK
jgi:hypothetical protein